MSIFNTINIKPPGLNKFDLSYLNMTTLNIGDLVPVMCKEMVPGDKFRVKTSSFVRMMPLANPTFQNLRLYMHYFFVPNRLLWDFWEDWIAGNKEVKHFSGGSIDTDAITPPYIDYNNSTLATGVDYSVQPLLDALGYRPPLNSEPSRDTATAQLSFRLRAYWLIYNEWYRDQNIDNSIIFDPKTNGLESQNSFMSVSANGATASSFSRKQRAQFAKRRYLKDYFTSALPWPQKGDDVMLPMGGEATLTNTADFDTYDMVSTGLGGDPDDVLGVNTSSGANYDGAWSLQTTHDNLLWHLKNTFKGVKVDLANVTSATINDLRRSVALQRFYEINARGGSRYIETILSHFGVHSKDARLQRPEFLGGGVTPIQIGEVLQTAPTEDSPLATMAGRGYAIGNSNDNGCVYRATEHGILMCIASIVPESLYFQGLDSHLQKFDRLDYYWPSFAHLGEQEIKRKELYYSGTSTDDELFGYAPRYSEYKHSRNEMHGGFVTDPTLKNWTFAREFTDSPALTSEFLEIPDITGPFAVEDGDKFLCQIHHQIDALRPMPYYSDPRLI